MLQYRNRSGEYRRLTIGRYGVLTPEQAREVARKALSSVLVDGKDPARQRKEDRSAWKIKDLCDDYLREAEAGNILDKKGNPKRLSTLAIDRGRISRHILPRLGKKAVRELKPSDVRQFFLDVKAGKTAADVKTRAWKETEREMKTFLLTATVLAAFVTPAAATTGPGCLVVVNVASDDVLNMRAGPSAQSRIVDALVPGRHGIIHLDGDCGPKNVAWGSRWCPVTHYDGDQVIKGWVKARFVRDSECP